MGKLGVVGPAVILGGGVSAEDFVLFKFLSFDFRIPKTFSYFKKGNGGGCVQSLFPGLAKMKVVSGTIDSSKSSEKVDSIFVANKKYQSDGCLVVNWNKKTSNGEKEWEGNFRFLWALQQEDKGFVVFTTADTTYDAGKKLLWDGAAYSLEQKKGKWELTNKKEVKSSHKTDKSTTNSKVPKPNSYLSRRDFWGFMDSQDDMDKICRVSHCTGAITESFFEGYWTWKGSSGGESKPLKEWTSNGVSVDNDSWWKELFGHRWDMGKIVEGMTGEWENKVWRGIAKPES